MKTWNPKSEYAKKLEHPKWQAKRLEIMSRDGMKCCECGDSETQLHVHHRYYVKHRDPWEYPDWSMVTLCKTCHKDEQDGAEFGPTPNQPRSWETVCGALMAGAVGGDIPERECMIWDLGTALGMASNRTGVSVGDLLTDVFYFLNSKTSTEEVAA